MRTNATHGFTLVEILIATVIVAILLAIAVPSYQEHIRRSRQSEAKSAIYALAQTLERYFTNNNTYTGTGTLSADGSRLQTLNFPAKVPDTGVANYTLSVTVPAGGASYTITATRTGLQANDKCGNFTLTAAGARGLASNTDSLAKCWN